MTLNVNDRLDINDLYSVYGRLIDFHDPEGWARLFTSDGLWQLFIGADTNPAIEVRGRDAITEMARHDNEKRDGLTRHWSGNVVVDGAGDLAVGHCYSVVLDLADGATRIESYADVDDELVKIDGRWHFARRAVRVTMRETHLE